MASRDPTSPSLLDRSVNSPETPTPEMLLAAEGEVSKETWQAFLKSQEDLAVEAAHLRSIVQFLDNRSAQLRSETKAPNHQAVKNLRIGVEKLTRTANENVEVAWQPPLASFTGTGNLLDLSNRYDMMLDRHTKKDSEKENQPTRRYGTMKQMCSKGDMAEGKKGATTPSQPTYTQVQGAPFAYTGAKAAVSVFPSYGCV